MTKPTIKKISKPRKIKKVRKLRKKHPPITADKVGTSKIEKVFGKFLESIGLEVKDQLQIAYKFYDFVVVDTKVVIEMQGGYWHCDPRLYPDGPINGMQRKAIKNDKFKAALAASNGYTLICVWEKDFNDDKEKVKRYVLEQVNIYREKENKLKSKENNK